MTERGSLLLDDQLCFAVYAASRALTRAYAPLLEPLGLTYPQYLALLVLWQQDDISVKELGERLALDSGTLTPLLKRLEQQGVLTRKRDRVDERVVRVLLTSAGRALKTKAKKVPMALVCRAGFDVDDKGALARLIDLRAELRSLTKRLDNAAAS